MRGAASAKTRLPLPLGGLTAKRSLLSVDNLVEAIDTVLRIEAPLRRPLIVADPDPLTIAEMIVALRRGLGRSPGLIPVPASLLELAARLSGREEAFRRIAGALVVSPDALMRCGWQPSVTSQEGLARLARESAAP